MSRPRSRLALHFSNPLAPDRMFDNAVDASLKLDSPKVLYHYTTWSGAEGILRNKCFWATAHDCTNDDAEILSADTTIIEVASALQRSARGSASTLLNLFLKDYPNLQITRVGKVYLTCFSRQRDDKDQWRKYADNGRGICLGIRMLDEPGPMYADRGTAIVRVDYSEASWRESISGSFGKICAVMNRASATAKNLELGLFALYRVAAFAAIAAKKGKWSIEQEYRRVTLLHKSAQVEPMVRLSGGRTVRFLPMVVRVDEQRIALAEIIVGPNQDTENARQKLGQLLADVGYKVGDMEYPEINDSAVSAYFIQPEIEDGLVG